MGFVDKLLVDAVHEQLDLVAFPFDGAFDDVPFAFAGAHAARDFGGDVQRDFHDFRIRHDIDMLHAVILFKYVHNHTELIREGCVIARRVAFKRLEMHVENRLAGEACANLLEERKTRARINRIEFGTAVRDANFIPCEIFDIALHVRIMMEGAVMASHGNVVFCETDVEFDFRHAVGDGHAESGHGVFRSGRFEAAMRADSGIGILEFAVDDHDVSLC